MEYKLSDLMRVSNYAKLTNKSVTWINKLAVQGKITIVEIDGYRFVVIKDG